MATAKTPNNAAAAAAAAAAAKKKEKQTKNQDTAAATACPARGGSLLRTTTFTYRDELEVGLELVDAQRDAERVGLEPHHAARQQAEQAHVPVARVPRRVALFD